jgi:capsule polysaccharide export protein KpsE/RkpR
MTREYTATSRIVIEPPAGDVRAAATAVSPIYLESLKTYESFAGSDSLFRKATAQFELRAFFHGRAIESVKKRVLKVAIVRNTRILEISATLPDPHKAQALAQFVAESAAGLNQSLSIAGNRDLLAGIEDEQRAARAELERADAAWAQALATEPIAGLQAEMQASAELRAKLEEQITAAQVELAGAVQREKDATESELPQIHSDENDARARMDELRKQIEGIDRQSADREKLLAGRLADRDKLDAERKARQAALAAIETRLTQARGDAAYRGERLRIIDPGIVPERPSSPNLPLNVAVALVFGFTLPVVYLAIEMNFREERVRERRAIHALRKAQ